MWKFLIFFLAHISMSLSATEVYPKEISGHQGKNYIMYRNHETLRINPALVAEWLEQ